MLLTVDGHRRVERVLRLIGCRLRVWLDDHDVTERCFVSDEAQGYVGLYRLSAGGRRFVEGGSVASELLCGRVTYVVVGRNGRRVLAVMTADGEEGVSVADSC